MIRGYVSSDEDDYDDYDFGYSEPLVRKKKELSFLSEFKTEQIKEKIHSALEECQKIEIFLKAVDKGDLETIEELISLGVSADSVDSQGWTPLMKACGQGNVEVVQFLLEHGADSNKKRELLTPLMTCCTYTLVPEDLKLSCVRVLLQYGAEVNAKDKFHTTALMYAVISGYPDIVAELLAVPGIDVNIQDKEGWTAIFHAVDHNYLNLTKTLHLAGSDIKLKDRFGRTVVNLALNKGLIDIAVTLGYVEEIPDLKERQTLRERFLNELPDSKGQGGFYEEAASILHSFNQLNVKNISLFDFLNATDRDLYEIGVKLGPDRQIILSKGIHRYHLYSWKKSSLHQIKHGVPLSMEDAIVIVGSLARDLTIINASVKYVRNRIFSRQKPVNSGMEKEMMTTLSEVYFKADFLKFVLTDILKQIHEIKPGISADYIYPIKKENCAKKYAKFFWYAVGAAMAGYFICYKSALRFRTLVTLLLHPVAVWLQFPQPDILCDCIDENFVIDFNE